MFVADLYLTLSYFVSFVHDYCDKLTNYRAIIFKFSHLSRDKFELSRDNLRKKKRLQCPLRATVHNHFKQVNRHLSELNMSVICLSTTLKFL